MNEITISGVTTAVIAYREVRVCTTQQLADLYGADAERIRDNFRKNADRFEEGKHFFKLEGDELRQVKNDIPDLSRYVPERTARLILWTEKGAARHAKMLTTDTAWEVFEQLEDAYFRVKEAAPAKPLSPAEVILQMAQQVVEQERRTAAIEQQQAEHGHTLERLGLNSSG